jgi:hypothetical protein
MDGGVAGFGQRQTWMTAAAIALREWCFKLGGGKVDAGLSTLWVGVEFGAI